MHTTQTPIAAQAHGLAIIGRTVADLRGHRFGEGEGGNAPVGAPPAPAPAPAGTPAAPAPAAPSAPAEGAIPLNPATGVPFTAAETQARISSLNAEAKGHREAREAAEATATAANAQRDAVLAALGLTPTGGTTPPDPAQLEATLAERTAAVDSTARENLVLRIAGVQGVVADKLLDSKEFDKKLSALKSDDRAGVETLVSQWVTDHPEHKAAPVAAASSGGTSHTGNTDHTGRKTKAAALAERYNTK